MLVCPVFGGVFMFFGRGVSCFYGSGLVLSAFRKYFIVFRSIFVVSR